MAVDFQVCDISSSSIISCSILAFTLLLFYINPGTRQLLNDAGVLFSPREKSLIRKTLPQLKEQYKIAYWGRIEGVTNDYHIIKAWDEYLGPKKFFYSNDCVDWVLVPEIDPRVEEFCKFEQGLFFGDPKKKIRFRDLTKLVRKDKSGEEGEEQAQPQEEEEEEPPAEEEPNEEETEEEEEERLKRKAKKPSNFYTEDKRIAVFLKGIETTCALVPLGFLYLTATHIVDQNESWKGLTETDSLKLSSYLHQRFPIDPIVRRNLEVKGINKPHEFLDDASKDEPVGTWSLQYNPHVSLVILRSLVFPGFQLYLRPESSQWGTSYVGNALIHIDIPFALPAVPKEETQPKPLLDILKGNSKQD